MPKNLTRRAGVSPRPGAWPRCCAVGRKRTVQWPPKCTIICAGLARRRQQKDEGGTNVALVSDISDHRHHRSRSRIRWTRGHGGGYRENSLFHFSDLLDFGDVRRPPECLIRRTPRRSATSLLNSWWRCSASGARKIAEGCTVAVTSPACGCSK